MLILSHEINGNHHNSYSRRNYYNHIRLFLLVLLLCFPTLCSCYKQISNPNGDFKNLGCNDTPLSVIHYVKENGFVAPCTPGVDCAVSNTTYITTTALWAVTPGSRICYTIDNSTEYNNTDHLTPLYPTLTRISFTNLTSLYPVLGGYEAAVNINIGMECLCACPGGLAALKCQSDFNYCNTDYCKNYYIAGVPDSDCLGSELGPFSTPSSACCKQEFPVFDTAYFFYLGPKSTASIVFDVDVFTKNTSTDNYSVQNGPPLTLVTFPNTMSTLFDTGPGPNSTQLYDICGWSCPFYAWNLSSIGTFDSGYYNGGDMFAIYNDQLYYVPDANKIHEYDPTKCGWLKQFRRGADQFVFDRQRLTMEVKYDSCVHDRVNISTDTNPCSVHEWIPASTYFAKWNSELADATQNLTDLIINGYLGLETSDTQSNTLITTTMTGNYYIASYTYGVSSYNCSSKTSFQSALIICDVRYDIGATYLTYTLYSKEGMTLVQSNHILDGTGREHINFTVPASTYSVVDKLCMNGNDALSKCTDIVVQGQDLQVINPNWVTVQQYGNTTDLDDSHPFNFFDWTTWEDNIWKTIVGFIIVFVIFVILVTSVFLVIWFSPHILNAFNRLLSLRRKWKYERLRKLELGHEMEDLNS